MKLRKAERVVKALEAFIKSTIDTEKTNFTSGEMVRHFELRDDLITALVGESKLPDKEG